MKRGTVVRHFVEMAELASELAAPPPSTFDRPLRELWAGGDITSAGGEIDHVVAVLILDVPAVELPENALHDHERGLTHLLDLHKRPMITRSRPVGRPAWSHLERRVVKVWSRDGGVEIANLDGLRTPGLGGATVIEPSSTELQTWLEAELPRSEAHLREVLEDYWHGPWRRDHSGGGIHPDDHLWRAAWAVQSMHDALRALPPR